MESLLRWQIALIGLLGVILVWIGYGVGEYFRRLLAKLEEIRAELSRLSK